MLLAIVFLKYLQASKLLVYVKAELATCLKRRIERDVPAYNVTPDQVRRNFELKVKPCCHLVLSQEQDAQLIITTD